MHTNTRRSVLRAGVGSLAAGLLAGRATGAEPTTRPAIPLPPVADPAPAVDARFPCQIAAGVWLIPDRRVFLVPNIGVVVGDKAALVVDCGLGPAGGRQVLAAARKLAPGRRLILTQTHAHPEHAFGAVAFDGQAEIFLNRAQNDYLTAAGPRLLTLFRTSFGPAVARLLDGVRITPATDTFAGDTATLDLGGRTVAFRNHGTAHSPGDQTIYVPDAGVLFAGDLIEERMFPIVPFFPPDIPRSAIDAGRWSRVLADVERAAPAVIVPGHGNLGGVEIARAVREYLDAVPTRIAHGADDAGINAAVQRVQAEHPTWEHQQFIAPALRYFAAG